MTTLLKQLREFTDDPIVAVQIGEMGWSGYNVPSGLPKDYMSKLSKVMKPDEAMPYLEYEFDSGFGAPNCTAVLIFTKKNVYSVFQYDGATGMFEIPRKPTKGFIPDMPGG